MTDVGYAVIYVWIADRYPSATQPLPIFYVSYDFSIYCICIIVYISVLYVFTVLPVNNKLLENCNLFFVRVKRKPISDLSVSMAQW